jgi:hypothetical protein
MRHKRLILYTAAFLILSFNLGIKADWINRTSFEYKKPYINLIDYQYPLRTTGIMEVSSVIYFIKEDALFSIRDGVVERTYVDGSKIKELMDIGNGEDGGKAIFKHRDKIYFILRDTLFMLEKGFEQKVKYLGANVEGLYIYDDYLYFAYGKERISQNRKFEAVYFDTEKSYNYKRMNLNNHMIENISVQEYENLYNDNKEKNFYDYKSFNIYDTVQKALKYNKIQMPFIKHFQVKDNMLFVLFDESFSLDKKQIFDREFFVFNMEGKIPEYVDFQELHRIIGFAVIDSELYINTVDSVYVTNINDRGKWVLLYLQKDEMHKIMETY